VEFDEDDMTAEALVANAELAELDLDDRSVRQGIRSLADAGFVAAANDAIVRSSSAARALLERALTVR
jgi:hypothetical protein